MLVEIDMQTWHSLGKDCGQYFALEHPLPADPPFPHWPVPSVAQGSSISKATWESKACLELWTQGQILKLWYEITCNCWQVDDKPWVCSRQLLVQTAYGQNSTEQCPQGGGQRKRVGETQLENLDNWFIFTAHRYSRYPSQQRDVEMTVCETALDPFQNILPVRGIRCMVDCKNGKSKCLGSSEFRVNFCLIFRPVTSRAQEADVGWRMM